MSPAGTPGSGSADAARDLEARNPGWVVLWRPWARRYWAFPLWITVGPEAVEARHPQDLTALIRQVELQHPPPGGPRHPPPYHRDPYRSRRPAV